MFVLVGWYALGKWLGFDLIGFVPYFYARRISIWIQRGFEINFCTS